MTAPADPRIPPPASTAHLVESIQALAERLIECLPDAILVADDRGRICEVNPQAEQIFGYSRAELIGQPIEMLIPERYRPGHARHRASYHAEPRMRPMGAGLELAGRRKDGSEFPVDILLSPVKTPDGTLALAVVRDITDRKQMEEALRVGEERVRMLLESGREYGFEEIVGESGGLKRVLKQAETVAPTDATALILGDTGTGKELIARAIHQLSGRRDRTFVKLNCSAIPLGLLESELFGHEKGAFTGAIAQKIGRLELAHRGTLFLDEIGDLPLELQPKILRALQEKEIERLGGNRTIPVDVRLIAATNRNLEKMIQEGQFRSDLYYRLNVFPIRIPPLHQRTGDIPLLVNYFVAKHARRMNKTITAIQPEVMEALTRWRWPGNVRELENYIERAVILTQGNTLRVPLAELKLPYEPEPQTGASLDANLEAAEREHILRVLRETKGVIAGPGGAAEKLGLKRTTLNSRLRKLGIEREDYR